MAIKQAKQRGEKTKVTKQIHTLCPYGAGMCPCQDGALVTVENGRIVGMEGHAQQPTLAAGQDDALDIQKRRREKIVISDDSNEAAPLDNKQPFRVARRRCGKDGRGQPGRDELERRDGPLTDSDSDRGLPFVPLARASHHRLACCHACHQPSLVHSDDIAIGARPRDQAVR